MNTNNKKNSKILKNYLLKALKDSFTKAAEKLEDQFDTVHRF